MNTDNDITRYVSSKVSQKFMKPSIEYIRDISDWDRVESRVWNEVSSPTNLVLWGIKDEMILRMRK